MLGGCGGIRPHLTGAIGGAGLQICHCEEAQPTWQSREGTGDPYRLLIKWYAPIASVAAFPERLVGGTFNRRSALVHHRTTLTCHSEERSDVGISCRQLRFRRWLSYDPTGCCEIATAPLGPRNDNSGLHTGLTVACSGRQCLPEIATGARRPRNDKSDSFAPLNLCHNHCQPARRSLRSYSQI